MTLVHRLCALEQDANPRRCVQNRVLRVQTPHWETEKYRYPEYVQIPGCRVAPIRTRPLLLAYLSARTARSGRLVPIGSSNEQDGLSMASHKSLYKDRA